MLYATRKHGYLGVVLDGALVVEHKRVIVARAQEHARDGREHRPGREPRSCSPSIEPCIGHKEKKRKKSTKSFKRKEARMNDEAHWRTRSHSSGAQLQQVLPLLVALCHVCTAQ